MHSIVKHQYSQLSNIHIGRLPAKDLAIPKSPKDLDLIIIIPCFAEEEIIRVMNSLNSCDRIGINFEVILLINESKNVALEHKKINEDSFQNIADYLQQHRLDWSVRVIYITDIPKKKAGVGMARKLAMDQAAWIYEQSGKLDTGIIVNLDADCTVSSNYLKSIIAHFTNNPKDELVSIAFQHRINEIASKEQQEAIRKYEAYLHYFIGMQRDLGLPYAFQTIGSAFAVRPGAYLQVGGMNKKKAGEDFYFIHKFTKKGTIAELNECTVYPSGRPSFRVPFGTGKAVVDMMADTVEYYTYHPQSFYDLKEFVINVEAFYTQEPATVLSLLPQGLQEYLKTQFFEEEILKIRNNTSKLSSFTKAFYQWFDAFRLMKYLHFVRDHYYPSIPIYEAIEITQEKI